MTTNTLAEFKGYINQSKAMRRCGFCNAHVQSLRDELSVKEYEISALCQDCQDAVFKECH